MKNLDVIYMAERSVDWLSKETECGTKYAHAYTDKINDSDIEYIRKDAVVDMLDMGIAYAKKEQDKTNDTQNSDWWRLDREIRLFRQVKKSINRLGEKDA